MSTTRDLIKGVGYIQHQNGITVFMEIKLRYESVFGRSFCDKSYSSFFLADDVEPKNETQARIIREALEAGERKTS